MDRGGMKSKVRLILWGALMGMALLPLSCDDSPMQIEPGGRTLLNIQDREWDPGRPDTRLGWCGEACIQMAMSHYGREVSQAAINRAAGVRVPEITDENMDAAMRKLGVAYAAWDGTVHDIDLYIAWIKAALRRGCPVICGIKTYPDEHPDWSLDHFVLAVGYDDNGLILNAQPAFGGQQHISYADLKSLDKGEEALSFQSTQHEYFARAITGLK